MFGGYPNAFLPVMPVGVQSSEEMLNLQKHYNTEPDKHMAQYRTDYMKNMFGLVPNQIKNFPNMGHMVKIGAETVNPSDGETSNHGNKTRPECDRPFIPYGSHYPTSELDNTQKNMDVETRSENAVAAGSARNEDKTEESRNMMNGLRGGKCDICGEVIHASNVKTGNKPTRCSECEKYFPDMPVLNSLEKFNHRSSIKLYSCMVCDKKFVSLATLKTHGRVHSGERPYKCSICDKTFVYEGNMKTHVRTHTGEKPFTCDECGKSFSQSGTLKKHLRMHSGEKPFKCEFCDKTFAYSENLIPHRRVHSGEKPFQCVLCKKSFTQPGSVKGHMKTMHNIKTTKKKKQKEDETVEESDSDTSEMDSVEQVAI